MKWRWRVWRNAYGLWVASSINATGFTGISYTSGNWRGALEYALGWVRWEAELNRPELGRMR